MNYQEFLPEYDEMLLPADVQKILRTGRNTVYKYLANGTIKSRTVAGKYRIPKRSLWEFIYPNEKLNMEGSVNVKTQSN